MIFIYRNPRRCVALHPGNASAHGQLEDISDLSNVAVIFRPKNTTAFLQPLDANETASSKKRYRKKQYQCALLLIEDENTKDLYNLKVLQAMRSLCSNWDKIGQKTIYDCRRKPVIIDSSTTTNTQEEEERKEIETVNNEGEDD